VLTSDKASAFSNTNNLRAARDTTRFTARDPSIFRPGLIQ